MNSQLRTDIIEIFHQGMKEVNPEKLIKKSIDVTNGKLRIGTSEVTILEGARIWVMGAGKAAGAMITGLEDIIGNLIHDGIVIVPEKQKVSSQRIQQFTGSHPFPDQDNLAATLEIMDLAKKVAPGDIVIFLISGGTSSLFEYPAGDLELTDLVQVHRLLLNSGADITEINAVRKHMSAVKGGRFLHHLRYARVYNLILSDVPGDSVSDIGSGPTNPDPTTYSDAWNVLTKYNLTSRIPVSVYNWIRNGMDGMIPETPKPGDTLECLIENHMTGTSSDLAEVIKKKFRALNYSARGSRKAYSLPVEKAADMVFADINKIIDNKDTLKKPVALVYHGESYVHVEGNGKGGRNTEFTLRMAEKIAGLENVVFLSAATDGIDGNTNAAGAICSGKTTLLGEQAGMNAMHYISDNDSWNYLKALGLIVHTGPTGNNLMDLQIALIGKS
jgi:glycerate 2-kinase